LKFLLKLLGRPTTGHPCLKFNQTARRHQTEKGFVVNYVSGWVECSYEITKLKIAPQEKALLKLDSDGLPVTDKELKVPGKRKGKITPGKTNVPAVTTSNYPEFGRSGSD